MGLRDDGLTLKEKQKKIRAANKKFLKKFKLEDNNNVKIGLLSEDENLGKIKQFKTGNIAIDILTGGGLFQGLPNVWWGAPDTGKTTSVNNLMAYTQKEYDATTLYANQENTWDREYAELLGVNPEMVELCEFENTEQALDKLTRCATGEDPVDIGVIDTLQALSPEGELNDGKDVKSVSKNTIGLLPRTYSQYFRMHTGINTGLTLLLISQVRTQFAGVMAFDGMTGGNAIKHYAMLILKMSKSTSTSAWPYSVQQLPENSFVATYQLTKIKRVGRYKGMSIKAYFVNGKFDQRFNIIAIGKDLGIHDGKSFTYTSSDGKEVTYTSRGLNEMINSKTKPLPDEGVEQMEKLLLPKFEEIYRSGCLTNNDDIDENELNINEDNNE